MKIDNSFSVLPMNKHISNITTFTWKANGLLPLTCVLHVQPPLYRYDALNFIYCIAKVTGQVLISFIQHWHRISMSMKLEVRSSTVFCIIKLQTLQRNYTLCMKQTWDKSWCCSQTIKKKNWKKEQLPGCSGDSSRQGNYITMWRNVLLHGSRTCFLSFWIENLYNTHTHKKKIQFTAKHPIILASILMLVL